MFVVNNFFSKVYNAGHPIDGGVWRRMIKTPTKKEKHRGGIADFKLKCWARMLVSSENIITSTLKFHDILLQMKKEEL